MECLKKYGGTSSSYLTLNKGVKYFIPDSFDGYIGYVEYANTVVALEPVCSTAHVSEIIHGFKSFCIKNKKHICFFGCTEETHEIFETEKFKTLYIGSELFVSLDKFTTAGGRMASVRRGINHARQANIRIEECFPEDGKSYFPYNKVKEGMYAVTKDWLKTRATPELTFMVGNLSFELPDKKYFIAFNDENVKAFAVYNPIYARKSYYLDLNRRRRNAPNGTMELLFSESFKSLKQEGTNKIYLGLSPFSNMQNMENHFFLSKIMRFLYEHFDFFYPAKSEYFFKQKFSTGSEKRYLCYYPKLSPRMIYAIFLSFCPGGLRKLIFHKIKKVIMR
jgi:phosphatidylglycerol lysyltransferase